MILRYSLAMALLLSIVLALQPGTALAQPVQEWVLIERQDFDNGDLTGWSGGSVSSGQYSYSGTASSVTFTKAIPAGLPIATKIKISLYAYAYVSATNDRVTLTIQYTNSSGTYTVYDQTSGVNTPISTTATFEIPYDSNGLSVTVRATKYVSGTPLTFQADNFELYVYGVKLASYSFSSSSEAAWWSGGSISGGAYSSTALTALNFTNREAYSNDGLIVKCKSSYSFSASASRNVAVSLFGTQVASWSGTSGSYSNWVRYGYGGPGIPFAASTTSGSLSSQSLSIDDVEIVYAGDISRIHYVKLYDEYSKTLAYNTSLSYTLRLYYSSGVFDQSSLLAAKNIIKKNGEYYQAVLAVSDASLAYERTIAYPQQDINFYVSNPGDIIGIQVSIIDYVGIWGSLQGTRISVYDFDNNLITEGWVDVGYSTILYLRYGNSYMTWIKSKYASYQYGLLYAINDKLSIPITVQVSGMSLVVNATRLDSNTIRVYYYDPQNATINATVKVTMLTTTLYENTTTAPTTIWDVPGCADSVPISVRITAFLNTNKGIEQKEWIIGIGLSSNNTSTVRDNSTTPLDPPFSISAMPFGFPLFSMLALFVIAAVTLQFPSPYMRYALIMLSGFMMFFAYSNWMPELPQAAWLSLSVITLIYALLLRRRL